jgi:hypothetical protein
LARLLALDWDNHEYHLVSANISRGRVHFERAFRWREEMPFTASKAEEFGQRLRKHLADAGIAPAPILVGLGRDRMVVKEIRYPQVDASDEPALVRMQIVKELTESPNDVYIDYCPLPESGPNPGGQCRALSLVARKDMVLGIQEACKSAGLKLLSITARPFGIAACYKRLAGSHAQVPAPPAPDAVVLVLTVAGDWADYCVVRGEQLLFSRALTVGDGLFGEVRRNLAAYAGQPNLSFPRDAIQAVYVTGDGENAALREKLQGTLGIPVHGLDPFINEERIDAAANSRAGFAGAVGLLQLWAEHQATPVNFVKPREAKPVASPTRRRFVLYGVAAAVLLIAAVIGATQLLAHDSETLAQLRERSAAAEKELKALQPEAKYLEALREWVDGDISDLDEIYDLVARAPWVDGFRIIKVDKTVLTQNKTAKEKEKDKDQKFLVRFNITGRLFRKDQDLIKNWVETINSDPHCKASSPRLVSVKDTAEAEKTLQEFTLQIDVARQPASKYTTVLRAPNKR